MKNILIIINLRKININIYLFIFHCQEKIDINIKYHSTRGF